MAKPKRTTAQRTPPARPLPPAGWRTVKYEFKAFGEKGFLSLYVCDTLEEAERERRELHKHYQKKLKHAVKEWERLTKEGATNFQFAWSAAGGREKPTIEQWTSAMTPVLRVTREAVSW